jgi:hypothetical protein
MIISSNTHLRTAIRALAEAPAVSSTRIRRSTERALVDEAGSISGRLVPWDTPAEVADEDGRRYRESFAAGGLQPPAEVIPVYAGHRYHRGQLERGPLVGRLDDVENRADGLYGRVVLADVPAAAELRALARTVGATFSVEFADTATPAAEVIRTGAVMSGLAVLTAPHRGAYPGATVTEVRAAPTDTDDEDEDDEDEGDGVEGTDPDAEGAEGGIDGGQPPAARAAIRREVERIIGRAARPVHSHPLARYGSFYDLMVAARASASNELAVQFATAYHARALADQVTSDNPGVNAPGWLSEVFGIIDAGRPVINAIGTRPLPASGMEVDWPYFDGDLYTMVGQQTTQKSEITSVKVSLKKGSAALVTYAGGSDISWQLIRRSQPSYRETYLRILQAAYGAVTDQAASDAVGAIVGGSVDWDPAGADADGSVLRGAIFSASVAVQQATGQPASFVLAAPDVFVKFGAMPGLVPGPYGTQNVAGTATASSLDVNVSGLRIVLAPDLAAGTMIVSNRLACSWFEDGPFVVAAPEVAKLGEDVAIWSMSTFAAFIPAGVVKLSNITPLSERSSSSSSKAK